jgi:hypothetical protein
MKKILSDIKSSKVTTSEGSKYFRPRIPMKQMIILIHFLRDLRELPSAKIGRETLVP